MDQDFIPFTFVSLLALPFLAIQLAWYVAVIVLLYRIWQRVKHLPGTP